MLAYLRRMTSHALGRTMLFLLCAGAVLLPAWLMLQRADEPRKEAPRPEVFKSSPVDAPDVADRQLDDRSGAAPTRRDGLHDLAGDSQHSSVVHDAPSLLNTSGTRSSARVTATG